jgi:F-type H+-transporting ATPase subunit epsilon
MAHLTLKVITPEKEVLNETVDSVYLPTSEGEIGILPHHASLMTKVIPGELRIKKSGKETFFATGEGFVQIQDNVVTLLTDLAVDEKDIDEKAAEEARKRAQSALENKLSSEEYAETIAVLERSLAQLRIKRRHKTR